jgi:preprotein translocase subunit SecG
MTAFLYVIDILFIVVSVFLILLVLIQKGRGGGLASAFGGGAGGHTAFGSKTGDVLTWATSIVFGVFLLLAVAANLVFSKVNIINNPGAAATTAAPAGRPSGQTGGPTVPGAPDSSVPQAPLTADPGVANPPPAPPPGSPGTTTGGGSAAPSTAPNR